MFNDVYDDIMIIQLVHLCEKHTKTVRIIYVIKCQWSKIVILNVSPGPSTLAASSRSSVALGVNGSLLPTVLVSASNTVCQITKAM